MSDGFEVLTTLGEAGGILGMVSIVLALLIKMIKTNGCTLKCYNCNGKPLAEIDCEQGSASRRYLPKSQTPTESDTTEDTHVKPSDIVIA